MLWSRSVRPPPVRPVERALRLGRARRSRRACTDVWRILGGAPTADQSRRARSGRRLRRRARRHGPRQASSCGHSAGRPAEAAPRSRAERRARGLREDGVLFWVSEEDGSLSTDINEHARHLATIRGPELFAELAFLKPTSALIGLCAGRAEVPVAWSPRDMSSTTFGASVEAWEASPSVG